MGKVPGSMGKPAGGSEVPATPEAIRLSVMKELWFPILRNFTALMTEKSVEVRDNALEALIQTFDDHHAHFGEGLWREIFGQVLLPVLEDIRV